MRIFVVQSHPLVREALEARHSREGSQRRPWTVQFARGRPSDLPGAWRTHVDLHHAIRRLVEGRRVLSSSVLRCIVELEGGCCRSRETAERLWISDAGVKSHVSRSMRRFGMKNRVQLAQLVRHARDEDGGIADRVTQDRQEVLP